MKSLVMRAAVFGMASIVSIGAAGAGAIEEWGGSDYVIFDTDPAATHDPAAWRDNSQFHTPPCQFDERAVDVRRDLDQMHAAGQRKLALMVWFTHIRDEQDCKGFLANSAGGRLANKVLSNLEGLVKAAGAAGFDELQVRFAPMGVNAPSVWNAWNEEKYQENWGVIRTTVAALLKLKGPRLLFDLGAEAVTRGQSDAYVQRLWADYARAFPPEASYGFSVAMAPGQVSRLLRDMQTSGPAPTQSRARRLPKSRARIGDRGPRDARRRRRCSDNHSGDFLRQSRHLSGAGRFRAGEQGAAARDHAVAAESGADDQVHRGKNPRLYIRASVTPEPNHNYPPLRSSFLKGLAAVRSLEWKIAANRGGRDQVRHRRREFMLSRGDLRDQCAKRERQYGDGATRGDRRSAKTRRSDG